MGSFTVNATNTPPVVSGVSAQDVIFGNLGDTSYSFTIEYSDVGGVDASSIDTLDVTVTGPGGALTVVSGTTSNPDGSPVAATYTVTPPPASRSPGSSPSPGWMSPAARSRRWAVASP